MAPSTQGSQDNRHQYPRIVGVYATSARSGKGSVADILIGDYGYARMQFSTPIKDMFSAFARNCGLSPSKIERCLEGDLKEVDLPELGGFSFRSFAETLADGWGRGIRPNLWVELFQRKLEAHFTRSAPLPCSVVIDDLRYPNEFWMVRRLGGVVIEVSRPKVNGGRLPAWPSEGLLEGFKFDDLIVNAGPPRVLKDATNAVMARFARAT